MYVVYFKFSEPLMQWALFIQAEQMIVSLRLLGWYLIWSFGFGIHYYQGLSRFGEERKCSYNILIIYYVLRADTYRFSVLR